MVTAVRRAISAGQIAPGTKLPEELIADQFETTRAKIRIAFQQLAFENLVELKRNRGAFIANPSAKEAKDVFAARQVIERATTEIVTRTITTHQIGGLRAILTSHARDWDLGRREAAVGGISQFHRSLAALAHNEALSTALERLILRTSLVLGLYGTSRGFGAATLRYRLLLDLIERGDSSEASISMGRTLHAMLTDLDLRNEVSSGQEHVFAPAMLQRPA